MTEIKPDKPKSPVSPRPISRRKALLRFHLRALCFLLILGCALGYGAYVLTPKYDYGICPMLNLYAQPRNSVDVLVVGTSVAYAGLNTNVLWREYGLACYDLCSAETPYWSSYYQLREALRYQKPRLILLDAKAAVYTRDYSLKGRTILSTFGILHLDNRIGAILACQKTVQQAMEFVWAYPEVHKYYKSLKWEDFLFPPNNGGRGTDWKGYMETDNIEMQLEPSLYPTAGKTKINERQMEYLLKILDLAQAEQIPLHIVGFPCPAYSDELPYYRALWTAAEERGVPWTDYNLNGLNQGLDYFSDFADLHHLNVKGSMKFSVQLGKDLLAAYSLPDRRGDPAYASYDLCAEQWYARLDTFVSRPRDDAWKN